MEDEVYNSMEQGEGVDNMSYGVDPMLDEMSYDVESAPYMMNPSYVPPRRPSAQSSSKQMFRIILGILLIIVIGGIIFLVYTLSKQKKKKDNKDGIYINSFEEDILNDKELYNIAQDAYVKGYTYENKKEEPKKEETEKPKINADNITKTQGTFSDDVALVVLADIGVSLLVDGTLKYSMPMLKKAAIPLAKFSVQAKNILSVSKSMFKNPATVKQLGTQLFKKVFKSTAGEIGEKVSQKIGSELAETVAQQGAKGISSAAKSSAGAVGKSLARVTGKFAELSGRMAAKGGIRSMFSIGKMAKMFKPSPMMLLSAVSIGLDMADVGGYGKMQTVAGLLKMKDGADKEFKAAILETIKKGYDDAEKERQEQIAKKEIDEKDNPPIVFDPNDIDIPPIMNPLNDITEEEENTFFDAVLTKILDPVNKNALALPIREAIENDLQNKVLQPSDVERVGEDGYRIKNEDILARYAMLIRSDEIVNYFYEELCKSKGGILTKDGTCTYSKDKCHSLYPWPLPEPKKDKDGKEIDDPNAPVYSEFRDGACRMALPVIRTSCDENNLKYNYETGICEISKGYCESKGGEWRMNDEIKQMDCLIPAEQQVAEFIFGTTITRGLKQLFDPAQMESCGVDGPFKIRDKCIDLPNGKTDVGVKPRIWDCNNTSSQKFFYDTRSKSIFVMKDYKKCFDTVGSTLNEGEKIQLSECKKKDTQQFLYDPKTKLIVARKDKTKCIGISENRFVSGNPNWKNTNNPNDPDCMKNWTYYDTDGASIIKKNISNLVSSKDYHVWSIEGGMMKHMNSGLCLTDALDAPKSVGSSNIKLDTCDNTSVKQRFIYDATNKTIKHSNTKKCVVYQPGPMGPSRIELDDCAKTGPNITNKWEVTTSGQIKRIGEPSIKACVSNVPYSKELHLVKCREGDGNWCATKKNTPPPNDTPLELVLCNSKDENQRFHLKRNMLADSGHCGTWRWADCPKGYTNTGSWCGRGTDDKTLALNPKLGIYETADCPPGYYNDGTNCMFKLFGRGTGRDDLFYDGWKKCAKEDGDGDRNNCEKWGTRVYPKCQFLAKKRGYENPDKWTNDGCCVCSPQKGYRSFSLSEKGKCPPSNDETGKYTELRGLGLCYIDCQKTYGDEYTNSGFYCHRTISTKSLDSATCDPDTEVKGTGLYVAKCLPKVCPPGYFTPGNRPLLTKRSVKMTNEERRAELKAEEEKNMYVAMPNPDKDECIRGKRRAVSLSLDYKAEDDDTIGMPS